MPASLRFDQRWVQVSTLSGPRVGQVRNLITPQSCNRETCIASAEVSWAVYQLVCPLFVGWNPIGLSLQAWVVRVGSPSMH